MDHAGAGDPESRAERLAPRYDWRRVGTNGPTRGTSGLAPSAFVRAYGTIAVFLLLIDIVNVLSSLYDAARVGRQISVWTPVTAEFTSWAGHLAACGLIYLAIREAPPGRAPWTRIVMIHAPASVLFSGAHIAVMMSLRALIHLAQGVAYRPSIPGDLIYEYRKDVIAYIVFAGIFWLVCRRDAPADRQPARSEPLPAYRESAPLETASTFDIVDGARRLRTPVRETLAVRASGNYVTFLLEDGRQPLMRIALGEVQQRLETFGFLRTHRSWLVNPRQMRSLQAAGSGDYRVELAGGAEAPLSRRFPEALGRLRNAGSPTVT